MGVPSSQIRLLVVVVDANNQGVPFVLLEPGARISQEMMLIATSLLKSRAAVVAGTR